MELQGRVALVTGGARGIGAAIAEELARQGARVAIVDLEPGSALVFRIEEIGGVARALKGDVADLASAEEVVQEVTARWGRLDILVLNAGITRDSVIWKMNEEAWDEVLRVNLKGRRSRRHPWALAARRRPQRRGLGRVR